MTRLPTACPACSAPLRVVRLACEDCTTHLDGSFALPALLRLPPEELEFVVDFVQSSGSLKKMAKLRGHSYPTIRSRLDRIIDALQSAPGDVEQQREVILDAIAAGTLTVAEAAKRLREVGR